MKLYLISQSVNSGYDTFDSAVVAAPDRETARNTSPARYRGPHLINWTERQYDWCDKPEQVDVEYLGEDANPERGWRVICSSYNAG